MRAIELEALRMEYVNGRGIHGLTMQVERGEIFGFLGPNGAGKSTTIRTLLGMLSPDGGTARVAGHDIVTDGVGVRRATGYLPSENALYLGMSGEEALIFSLRVRGCLERMERGVELSRRLRVDLRPKLRSLSHGQRQKAAIVVAMAHGPEVLILDEPTTGLDPLVQEEFFGLLREERDAGRTVFLSSHVLSEVERLCGRVGIIRDGLLVEVAEVEALRRSRAKQVSVVFRGEVPDFGGWDGCVVQHVEGLRVRLSFHGAIGPLLGRLAGSDVVDASIEDLPLEAVFRAFYREGSGEGGGSGT